jgi:hypothetical protein
MQDSKLQDVFHDVCTQKSKFYILIVVSFLNQPVDIIVSETNQSHRFQCVPIYGRRRVIAAKKIISGCGSREAYERHTRLLYTRQPSLA